MNQKQEHDELKEITESFAQYSRKTSSWWYLVMIMIVIFGVSYVYNQFNNRRTPTEMYREELVQQQEKIDALEKRVETLEEQLKNLKN